MPGIQELSRGQPPGGPGHHRLQTARRKQQCRTGYSFRCLHHPVLSGLQRSLPVLPCPIQRSPIFSCLASCGNMGNGCINPFCRGRDRKQRIPPVVRDHHAAMEKKTRSECPCRQRCTVLLLIRWLRNHEKPGIPGLIFPRTRNPHRADLQIRHNTGYRPRRSCTPCPCPSRGARLRSSPRRSPRRSALRSPAPGS